MSYKINKQIFNRGVSEQISDTPRFIYTHLHRLTNMKQNSKSIYCSKTSPNASIPSSTEVGMSRVADRSHP